jgi:hypothetical protein
MVLATGAESSASLFNIAKQKYGQSLRWILRVFIKSI